MDFLVLRFCYSCLAILDLNLRLFGAEGAHFHSGTWSRSSALALELPESDPLTKVIPLAIELS